MAGVWCHLEGRESRPSERLGSRELMFGPGAEQRVPGLGAQLWNWGGKKGLAGSCLCPGFGSKAAGACHLGPFLPGTWHGFQTVTSTLLESHTSEGVPLQIWGLPEMCWAWEIPVLWGVSPPAG